MFAERTDKGHRIQAPDRGRFHRLSSSEGRIYAYIGRQHFPIWRETGIVAPSDVRLLMCLTPGADPMSKRMGASWYLRERCCEVKKRRKATEIGTRCRDARDRSQSARCIRFVGSPKELVSNLEEILSARSSTSSDSRPATSTIDRALTICV